MNRSSSPLIDSLVADLAPVAPMRAGRAVAMALAATALAIAAIGAVFGLRSHVSLPFLLASGLFLILGLAAALAVIAMARPQVGNDHASWNAGWGWASAMAALLPLSALALAARHPAAAWQASEPREGAWCLAMALAAGLGVGGVLVAWLRRGAPTSPQRAGLVTGIAAGGLGLFAFSLHCPEDGVFHIGIWHSAPVLLAAIAGRLIVPRLIRW